MNVLSVFESFVSVHFFIYDAFLSFCVYVIHKINTVFPSFSLNWFKWALLYITKNVPSNTPTYVWVQSGCNQAPKSFFL